MDYFDYEQPAREAGIRPEELARMAELVRQEFPSDDMLYELHLLRICMSIRDGELTIAEALQGEAEVA